MKKNAFTLAELLVWITIIWILALMVSNINYNRLSDKQKLEIFVNSVKTNFETIRNNSLEWKWIWNNLLVPNKRSIKVSKISNWTIVFLNDSSIYNKLTFDNWIVINKIRCLKLDKTQDSILNSTSTWIIEFKWANLSLTWACSIQTSKILEVEFRNKSFNTKTIEINTLNWLTSTK